MEHHYERIGFRAGAFGHRLDATAEEVADDCANVWGWDGNRESPTLQPSFLAVEVDKKGRTARPYRAHLFVRDGKIELCGDSTVTLHSDPQPCWDDWGEAGEA
jgi:hypothetical protein